ncbi:MAG TPA: DNA translocase FtsK [Trichocoleus sp.]|jgi:DNA segregation ATPase FtsK/SpoIIIE-like protein
MTLAQKVWERDQLRKEQRTLTVWTFALLGGATCSALMWGFPFNAQTKTLYGMLAVGSAGTALALAHSSCRIAEELKPVEEDVAAYRKVSQTTNRGAIGLRAKQMLRAIAAPSQPQVIQQLPEWFDKTCDAVERVFRRAQLPVEVIGIEQTETEIHYVLERRSNEPSLAVFLVKGQTLSTELMLEAGLCKAQLKILPFKLVLIAPIQEPQLVEQSFNLLHQFLMQNQQKTVRQSTQTIAVPHREIKEEISAGSVEPTHPDTTTIGQTIASTLQAYGINTQVIDAIEGMAIDRYWVQLPPGKRVAEIEKHANELWLNLQLSQSPMISIDRGAVAIDVPRKDRKFCKFTDYVQLEGNRSSAEELVAVIGLDLLGNVVELNIASPDSCQVRGGGCTGSGKSEGIASLILSLAHRYPPEELQIYIADGKMHTYTELERLPHLAMQIARTPDELITMATIVANQMDERYGKTFAEYGCADIKTYRKKSGFILPRILFIIDEYGDFRNQFISAARTTEFSRLEATCTRIGQKGRSSGIHEGIFTQKPSVEVLDSELRSQLKAALAFKMEFPQESACILGDSNMKADKLLGKGDGILAYGSEEIRFQGLFCGIEDGLLPGLIDRCLSVYQGYPTVEVQAIPVPAPQASENDPYSYRYPPNWGYISQLTKQMTDGYCCFPGCANQATETHHAMYEEDGKPIVSNPVPGRHVYPLCDIHHGKEHPRGAHNPKNWTKGTCKEPLEIDSRNTPDYHKLLIAGWQEKLSQ